MTEDRLSPLCERVIAAGQPAISDRPKRLHEAMLEALRANYTCEAMNMATCLLAELLYAERDQHPGFYKP